MTGDLPATSKRSSALLAGCAIALTAGLAYANALANGFALDDTAVIAGNPLVHDISGTLRAFAHTYWPEVTRAGQYRPLTIASFALDWSLAHGSPVWLHAANVLWHTAACLVLWRLLLGILDASGAFAGALLFAVHPVHVEAVANLVGRSELMCATFVLAALIAHRHGRWLAVPLYAAALLSKETGITFLGLAVAADVLLPRVTRASAPVSGSTLPGEAEPWSAWQTIRGRAHLYAAYAAVTIVYALTLAILFRDLPLLRVAAPWMRASPVDRWLTAMSIVPDYVRLLLFPLHLHVEYTPQVVAVAHGINLKVLLGAALTVGAVLLAVWAARSIPTLAFAVMVFAISIAPVVNILFPSGVVLAERTLYLPSVGLAIGAGWLWNVLAQRQALPQAASPGAAVTLIDRVSSCERRRWLQIAGACIVVALVLRTWTRTPVWRSSKTVIVASLLGEPTAYRAHERAGDVLERANDEDGALREYGRARALYREDPYLYEVAASIMAAHGDSAANAPDRLLDSARLVDPSAYDDIMRRARVRYAAHDFHGTITLARAAYLLERDSVDAIMVLTQAAEQIDDVSDAAGAFRLALADHPRDPALHKSYAAMLASTGDSVTARRELTRAGLRISPIP